MSATAEFTLTNTLAAIGIAGLFISLSSLIKEPERQKFNAILVGGAGAAYLSGGLGLWEFAFCTLMTYIAYKGLQHYYYIGIAWLLHTCWDVVHHLYAHPIVPFVPTSSAGCAICDSILAVWFFMGAPSVFNRFKYQAKTA
ncbi:DUF6010 family protein [Mucilaginibacter lacusdianchii]|uniref:DUF6010 family protein n=1 Tax=Mucilaginibacter lacusdianchii TaxID=2684211 RepID=UPI00131AD9D2|nr:DUF6010 family protein [Mucilaginibacter sp. JXJ CY 39]